MVAFGGDKTLGATRTRWNGKRIRRGSMALAILAGAALELVACDLKDPGLSHVSDASTGGAEASVGSSGGAPVVGSGGAGGARTMATGGALPAAGGADGSGGAAPIATGGTPQVTPDGGGGRTPDAGDGSTCKAGLSCTPAECQFGLTSCATGTSQCSKTGNVNDGTPCETGADGGLAGHVCSGGICEPCESGADCTDPGSCQAKKIVCSTGKPVCTPSGNVTDGTGCGTNLYCNKGSCEACVKGAGCVPQGKPCNKGSFSCVMGQAICNDLGTPADVGTPCGTNMVCNGTTSCVSCAANVTCQPTNPCHTGVTSCATGKSTCVDKGAGSNGGPCDDGNACTQTDTCQNGACAGSNAKSCPAIDICHEVGSCNMSTGQCTTPASTNGKPCNDGNACTLTDTCQSGVCAGSNAVTCTASDGCHQVGSCNQSTGICSNPTQPDNTPCGGGKICTGGSCACAAGKTSCNNGCVDFDTDKGNCGACGRQCSTFNASAASCSSGSCRATCQSGFLDCNHPVSSSPDDGCECTGTACCGSGCQTLHSSNGMEALTAIVASYYSCGAGYNQTSAMDACIQFINSNTSGEFSTAHGYTCVQLPSCVGMENSGGFVFYGWYYATNNSGTKGSVYTSMQKDFCGSGTPISTWN